MENINLTLQWFIFVKIFMWILLFFCLYKVYKTEGGVRKTYIGIVIVLVIGLIIAPVKMSVNTTEVHKQQSYEILHREIPKKVTDDSFKDSMKQLDGISKEDLK